MRVTNSIMFTNFLAQLQRLNTDFFKFNEQVTTGKRINRPSDDPVNFTNLSAIKSEVSILTQYVENTETALNRMTATDARLNDFSIGLTRAIQLTEQAANEPNVAEPRSAIAKELESLTQELLSTADARVGGRALFAGTRNTTDALQLIAGNPDGDVYSASSTVVTSNGSAATLTATIPDPRVYDEHILQVRITDAATGAYEVIDLDARDAVVATGNLAVPAGGSFSVQGVDVTIGAGFATGDLFTIVPEYAYNGTEDDIDMQIDENSSIVQNVTGSDAFGGTEPTGGVQNPGGTLFDDLAELRRAILTDDQPAILTSIDTMRARFDDMNAVRARAGGRIANLQNIQERNEFEASELLVQISKIESVDLPQAITKLTQTQTGLQAALSAAARIGQLNLFDFIG